MDYAVICNEIFIKSKFYEYGWKIVESVDEISLSYFEEESKKFVEKSKVTLPKSSLKALLGTLNSLLEVETLVDEDYFVERSLEICGTKVICIEEELVEEDWRQFKISCDGSEMNVEANNLKVLMAYLKKCNLVE